MDSSPIFGCQRAPFLAASWKSSKSFCTWSCSSWCGCWEIMGRPSKNVGFKLNDGWTLTDFGFCQYISTYMTFNRLITYVWSYRSGCAVRSWDKHYCCMHHCWIYLHIVNWFETTPSDLRRSNRWSSWSSLDTNLHEVKPTTKRPNGVIHPWNHRSLTASSTQRSRPLTSGYPGSKRRSRAPTFAITGGLPHHSCAT